MGLQPFYCNGPHPLLWAGLRAAREKITMWYTLLPELLWNFYSVSQLTNVAAGRIRKPGGWGGGGWLETHDIHRENLSHIVFFKWVCSCFLLENSWIVGSIPRPYKDLERFCVVPPGKCWFVTLKQAKGPSTFFVLLFGMTLTLYPTSSVQSLNCYIIHRYMHILTLRSLTLYIYGAPILDVSRSHTTTQHSR